MESRIIDRPQNSRQAQALLPDFSAGCLDADCETAVREWLEKCPECRGEWQSIQRTMQLLSSTPHAPLSEEESRRMWHCCREQIFEKVEAKRLVAQNPSFWNWFQAQPRWGWAALGGAVAILGSVLLGPDSTQEASAPTLASATMASGTGTPELTMFRQPSRVTSELVNHHSAMAMDPFTDHVGSTLVSYSATARQTRQ
ncbi:MAG: hypothetical protein JWN98_761 [Abditibacteriota bacterium]|nr:hypothetical protein [Abditibacteriota bacterium]